jgi:hypothetical protein
MGQTVTNSNTSTSTNTNANANANIELDDIDADGEYEMDDIDYEQTPAAPVQQHAPDLDGHTTDAEGSDVDAEGEDVDDDEDEAEPVGAVKIALRRTAASDEEEDYNEEDAAGESLSDEELSTESDEEHPWQGASENGEEDEEAVKHNSNACVSVEPKPTSSLSSADDQIVTANRMRTTIQAKSSKTSFHVPCVEILVCGQRCTVRVR